VAADLKGASNDHDIRVHPFMATGRFGTIRPEVAVRMS
jgi:hypothetical protein